MTGAGRRLGVGAGQRREPIGRSGAPGAGRIAPAGVGASEHTILQHVMDNPSACLYVSIHILAHHWLPNPREIGFGRYLITHSNDGSAEDPDIASLLDKRTAEIYVPFVDQTDARKMGRERSPLWHCDGNRVGSGHGMRSSLCSDVVHRGRTRRLPEGSMAPGIVSPAPLAGGDGTAPMNAQVFLDGAPCVGSCERKEKHSPGRSQMPRNQRRLFFVFLKNP
jgi:hypothetical protein